MNKGDKILMNDGAILEFVGKTLPSGNALKFLWRFEALDKHRYVEMSFGSAMLCRVAYLEHRIRAMEMGIPGFWLCADYIGFGQFEEPNIYSEHPGSDVAPEHLVQHYVFKNGKWVEDDN